MKPIGILGIVAAVLAAIVLFNSFFIVDQRRQALVLQVGAAVEAYNEPGSDEAGLKFKLPLVQNVVMYDRRNLGLNVPGIEAYASNQEQLIVDAFVRWQISDPLAFYQRLSTEAHARQQGHTGLRNLDEVDLPADLAAGQVARMAIPVEAGRTHPAAQERGLDDVHAGGGVARVPLAARPARRPSPAGRGAPIFLLSRAIPVSE